ncbi:unnamed protein product, partial [marine sediment metagenome]
MVRGNNTDANGTIFKSSTVDAVWKKGQIIKDVNPDHVRKDICG